jgi:hypothetical protein
MLLLDTTRLLSTAILSGTRGEGKDVISAEQVFEGPILGLTQVVMTRTTLW